MAWYTKTHNEAKHQKWIEMVEVVQHGAFQEEWPAGRSDRKDVVCPAKPKSHFYIEQHAKRSSNGSMRIVNGEIPY